MGFWAEVAATVLFVIVTIVCLAIMVLVGWAIWRHIVTDIPLPYRDPEPPTTGLRDTSVVSTLIVMYRPRTGPTPVGQRLRASTIPSRRLDGPTVEEWEFDDEEVEVAPCTTS